MKADPFAQLKLLDVQELDSKLDGIRHRLSTIPEAAELAATQQERGRANDRMRDLQVLVEDLGEEQRKADRDVEQVKTRRVRDQGMIDSGSVSNPKDIERMLHELQSLERRISDLEDVEIEVMERLENAQGDLEKAREEVARLDDAVAALDRTRGEKAAALEGEFTETTRERGITAEGLPDDLMTLYAKLREQKGGVGAAALRAKQCGGCRLTLDASVLRDIAAASVDEVVRCEECGRILVRTGESGL